MIAKPGLKRLASLYKHGHKTGITPIRCLLFEEFGQLLLREDNLSETRLVVVSSLGHVVSLHGVWAGHLV